MSDHAAAVGPRTSPSVFVRWTVTLGKHESVKALKAALRAAKCQVSDHANNLLGKPAFPLANEQTEVDLVDLSVKELGFEGNATYAQTCAKAVELGLELCPAEVGPALRLVYKDQPRDEWLCVAMGAITDTVGNRLIFSVEHDRVALWLDWDFGGPDCVWDPVSRFVFVLPRK